MVGIEKVMEQSEIGFARHKMIFDEAGMPVDYCFLAVNHAFERLTGLKRKELLNQRVSDVIPKTTEDDFDWIDFYGKIVTQKEKHVFEQYSAPLDKWYRVECFSSEKDCFTTLFTDITYERELITASKAFLDDDQENNTYEQIAQRMKKITGAKYVALNVFLEDGERFKTIAIAGVSSGLQKAAELLGFNPQKKEWAPDLRRMKLIKNQRVTTFDCLNELTSHVISKNLIQQLEKTFTLGKIVIIKSTKGERFIGDFTLMFSKGKELQNENEAIIYADMVAMLIEKRNRQQELEEKKNALKKAKDDLQTISDNMLDLISVTDLEGNYQFAGASHGILGYEINDLIGRNVMDFVHPDDLPQVQEEFAEFIRQKTKTAKAIYRYRCVDGTYVWFETLGTIILDEKDEPKEILFNTRDITKQKEMEEQFKVNQVRLELAMDSSQHGFWDKNLDTGEIYCSPRIYTMLGYEPDEFKMTAEVWQSLIHPEDRPFVPDLLTYLEKHEHIEHHLRLKCKDNRYKWISSKAKGHERDSQGKPHRAVGVHVDIDELKRKTEALKESHRMAKMGRWDYYHKQDILEFSEGVFSILEVAPEQFEATYQGYLNKLHPDDRKAAAQEWEESLENHQPYDTEYRLMLSDGRVKWIVSHCYTEYDKDGHPQHSVGIVQDITKQKKLENDIRKREREFQNLFETMAQGVVYQDKNGNITAANPSAERILGLTLDQLQGRTSTDPVWRAIHEDGSLFPGEGHPAMVALRTGQPVFGEIIGVYNSHVKKYHWIKVNAVPQFREREKDPYQVYATFEDITKEVETNQLLSKSRMQLEASLEETRKKNRHLEAMHEIAVEILKATDFLETTNKLINDCKRLTGATSGYVALLNDSGDENEVFYLDAGDENCTVDPSLPKPIRGLRGIAYQKGDVVYNNDFMHSNHCQYLPHGHISIHNVLYAPLKINGKAIGLLGLGNKEGGFNDEDTKTAKTVAKFISIVFQKSQLIAKLKEERKKAEEANRAKSEFLANMNHELRTPLNGIIGFSDILRNTTLDEDQNDFLGIIYSSAKHLSDIITDILDFSRIEAGKFELNPEKTKLTKLIEQTVDIVRYRAESKRLSLSVDVEKNVPQIVEVDGSRLRQILLNLLSNAVKFTDKGRVHLSVDLQEKQADKVSLLFNITDTGMGIKEKDQEKIFDPFQQLDMSSFKKAEGTGLGLVITKEILRKMGSSLKLKSTYGKGSTFSFELLLSFEKEQKKALGKAYSEIADSNPSFFNKKILIAEDKPSNMYFIQKALLMFSNDFKIFKAKNGEEAFQLYQKHKPDLILMDILMPEVDGYQAATMIRQMDKQIPIIALTAKALKEDREECLAVGMNDYITKPVSLEQLKEIIEKYLE